MDPPPLRITAPGRCLLLVAGVPGVGKSTLLAGLAPRPDVAVLDSDAHRAVITARLPGVPYGWLRPVVHAAHRLAVVRAAGSRVRCVLVHLPATATWQRAAVIGLARATGRRPHLLLLEVDPGQALAGQRERGRVVPSRSFARHTRRAGALVARLRAGRVGRADRGWTQILVRDRAAVRGGLVLDPAPGPPRPSGGVGSGRPRRPDPGQSLRTILPTWAPPSRRPWASPTASRPS